MNMPLLDPKPEPAQLDSPLREEKDIARHRRLYCTHYDGCLDHSIALGWQSFSCTMCPLSEAADKSPKVLVPFATARNDNPTH